MASVLCASMVKKVSAGSLVQSAHLVYGPVCENRFAVDQLFRNRAEVTAVVGEIAMVAEDEVGVRRHYAFGIAAAVNVIGRNVGLADATAVHVQNAVRDADAVARYGCYALD